MIVPNQIFRHFKGGLYLVLSLAKREEDPQGECLVVYRSLNGDDKVWTRLQSEFESDVPEEKFNPTGQKKRFELVTNLRNQLSLASTQSLIEELKTRSDSPFNDFDIEGLNTKVIQRDFSVADVEDGKVLKETMVTDSVEKARTFMSNHPERCCSRTTILKNVVIDVGL